MSSQKTGKRRRPPLSLTPGPRGRRADMPPPPLKAPRTHDGARDQEGTGPAGTRTDDDSASPESAPGNMDDDDYIYPDTDGGGGDDDDDMHVAVGQPAGPIQGRAAEEAARQEELARVLAKSMTDARSNENAPSGGAAEPSTHQGSSAGGAADGEDAPARGGLVNGGSTCWLNTLIQVASSPCTTLGRTLTELSRCEWDGAMKGRLSALWQMVDATGKVTSAEPGTRSIHAGFVGANGILNPAGFKAWKQQDVGEAFVALWGLLQSQATTTKTPLPPPLAATMVETSINAQCPSCGCVHSVANGSLEPHLMLHLPGESSDPATSLQDLLDAWTAPREMSDSVCASCSQLTSSQQVTFISKAPATLVVIINRTRWRDGAEGFGDKNNRPVQFGQTASLLVRSDSGTTRTQRYDVRGIGEHIGPSLNAGHYKAFVAVRNDTWVCADDADTTEVPWSDVSKVSPTVVVLERQQDGGGAAATHSNHVPAFWSAAVAAAGGQASGSGGQASGGVSGESSSGDTDGDGSGKPRTSCGGGRKKEHGGGCRENSSGNSSSGGGSSSGSGDKADGDSDRSGGGGVVNDGNGSSVDSSVDSSGGGGGGALSPAQADAIKSFERNPAWFLRIEDREVSSAERQEARRLLENPHELHGLRNEALAKPRVYRGTRLAEDLDRHQLRDLVGAALLPENGLSKMLGSFNGDLRALERACAEAELQGPVEFSKFLRARGIDAPVNPKHPAFAGDPTTWTKPILFQQAMCLQYQKRPFYHEAPTTTTGKASAAAGKVSSFEGGPAGHGNRLGASCVKVVGDRGGTSASAIPHCAALSELRPELCRVAGVVERSVARSYLHHFTATPGVGVFRGGDIAQAGCGRETVRELASVGGRKAVVYHGRHQSKAIGDPAALESAARGDLELYRACTNGEAVTDDRVGGRMVDILMEAIEIHAEVNGGEPTDNDIRRSDELEEARDQGLPHIREVTGRIGEELRGKHVRTKADCIAGAKADLKPQTVARPEYQRMIAAGQEPDRRKVDKTAAERGSTKSTNEAKAGGGRLGGEDGKNTGTKGGTGSGYSGAGEKNAKFTLQHATRVRKGLDPGFTHARCSQGAGQECGRCTHIVEWDGLAIPDLRPGKAQDAWVAVLRSHAICRRVPGSGRVRSIHKGALAPWSGNAATGRSLKNDEGVQYLSEYQAGEIVKTHIDLYKEWSKNNPDNN